MRCDDEAVGMPSPKGYFETRTFGCRLDGGGYDGGSTAGGLIAGPLLCLFCDCNVADLFTSLKLFLWIREWSQLINPVVMKHRLINAFWRFALRDMRLGWAYSSRGEILHRDDDTTTSY